MEDPINILNVRLANGEIDEEEYEKLLNILQPKNRKNLNEYGRLLFEFDDVKIYENGIKHGNFFHKISEIKSVDGHNSQMSVNYLPMEKSSSVTIWFKSGEKISFNESRVYLGGARHKLIRQLHAVVKQITFKERVNKFFERLMKDGRIVIHKPFYKKGEIIYLTKDGYIETETKKINIKEAKTKGTFGIGTESKSFGSSKEYNPNEIVIGDVKGRFGFIPSKTLQFEVNCQDSDVVHSLLIWFSDIKN